MWYLRARANRHGIAPNTTLGFRIQATLASLHGWYVAQRTGFGFVADGHDRRRRGRARHRRGHLHPARSTLLWIFLAPAVGGVAIAICVMIAGQRADSAALRVETTPVGSALGTAGF